MPFLFLIFCLIEPKMERKGHRMNQSSPQGLPEGVHRYAERLDWFIAKGILIKLFAKTISP